MSEQLKQTANQLGRMRKEHLINQSGSTTDDSLDKVRLGQSYLYMNQGMDSEVFEVRFKERVSGSDLTEAICYTLMRFPYINTRLIELDDDSYIVQNPVAMVAHPTKNLGKLGSLRTNEHLVEVTYHKNSAYFAFHHALCDARGVKPLPNFSQILTNQSMLTLPPIGVQHLVMKIPLKNTVKSMILAYTKNDTSKTFKEITTNYRTYLNHKKTLISVKKRLMVSSDFIIN